MKTSRIELPEKFVEQLIQLPESGMGYQKVSITLKSGEQLHNYLVFNCSLLQLQEGDTFTIEDIATIALENNKAA